MIIKEVRIDSFGVIKKKIISFDNGLNIVYGENEKGKSSIETFIKIMLYGFSTKKINGESERKRYISFNGSVIGGELLIEHNEKNYIIKRKFGVNKKEDTSIVLDALTGEEVNDINKEEIGKYFLGVNRKTYEKTLFINQLGVIISKDKEEEIMDKITAILSCSEEEVPVAKAIDRLEAIKKTLITIRGVGQLDLLIKREQELLEEAYEANKVCENNLEWEECLYKENNKKKLLQEEISNLEIYKKYLKKINLQKEYREITDYLKKSQELKKKEEEIISNISNGNEIINESYINNLKEENIQYINLINRKKELDIEINNTNEELSPLQDFMKVYSYFYSCSNDISANLLEKKYEKKLLEEKINSIQKTILEINKLEKDLVYEQEKIGDIFKLQDIKEEVVNTFNEYEKKLYEMKFIAENNDESISDVSKLKNIRYISIITAILGGVGIILNFPINIIGTITLIISAIFFYKLSEKIKESKKEDKRKDLLRVLTNEVDNIETKLNKYVNKINVNNYKELLNAIKRYNSYKEIEDKIKLSILEKRNSLSKDEYNNILKKYKSNKEYIERIISSFKCNNLDETLEKIKKCSEVSSKINSIKMELEGKKQSSVLLSESIIEKETSIRDKLKIIDLENIDLSLLDKYLLEYSNKINKYREIHNNLLRIEETYKVLLKERNIEKIKEDLNEFNIKEEKYNYSTEEEIEIEEKIKSKELLECEKKIKDLENNINNRLIGKRSLVEIEEELVLVKEEIIKKNKILKALELALKILIESLDEVKKDVGPELNKRIAENFNILTENKYNEVLLGNNYEMVVRDSDNLFKASYLSNGALDQLYLSLRIAFIQLLFNDEEISLILDDALVQYDDIRREKTLLLLNSKIQGQIIIFTCQNTEKNILNKHKIEYNYIEL